MQGLASPYARSRSESVATSEAAKRIVERGASLAIRKQSAVHRSALADALHKQSSERSGTHHVSCRQKTSKSRKGFLARYMTVSAFVPSSGDDQLEPLVRFCREKVG
jgi:hypothetical protein